MKQRKNYKYIEQKNQNMRRLADKILIFVTKFKLATAVLVLSYLTVFQIKELL
jgi:hypothetical protein